MAGLKADLAIGQVEDENGDPHNVTVAVLWNEDGVLWQSREAWGVGPGSAVRAVHELEKLRSDVEEQYPEAGIDWGVIPQVLEDIGED